eukprot:SAG22_NODE_5438_length_1013_cov_4.124726_1_plen_41_part_10
MGKPSGEVPYFFFVLYSFNINNIGLLSTTKLLDLLSLSLSL